MCLSNKKLILKKTTWVLYFLLLYTGFQQDHATNKNWKQNNHASCHSHSLLTQEYALLQSKAVRTKLYAVASIQTQTNSMQHWAWGVFLEKDPPNDDSEAISKTVFQISFYLFVIKTPSW